MCSGHQPGKLIKVDEMTENVEIESPKKKWLGMNFLTLLGLLIAVLGVWPQYRAEDKGNSVTSSNNGGISETTSSATKPTIVTTSVAPFTTSSSSSTTPLNITSLVLAAPEIGRVEGKSIPISDLYRTNSDGVASVKSTTLSVCTSSKGTLTFKSSGVCQVQISIGKSSKFKSISSKFKMNIRGALSSQALMPMGSIDETKYFNTRPTEFISQGSSIEWERPAGEFKTIWHVKLSIKLPTDNARCSKIFFNWRQSWTSSPTSTFGQKSTSCTTVQSRFDQCISFNPSKVLNGNIEVDLPIADGSSEKMKYAQLYWAINWTGSQYVSASNPTSTSTMSTFSTIPKNELLWHPAVDVLEVQQGACP